MSVFRSILIAVPPWFRTDAAGRGCGILRGTWPLAYGTAVLAFHASVMEALPVDCSQFEVATQARLALDHELAKCLELGR